MRDEPTIAAEGSYPDRDTFAQIAAAFDALRELSDAERTRRLQELARKAPRVAAEVERLLRLHETDGAPLSAPERVLDAALLDEVFAGEDAVGAAAPQTIGPWRLARLLGRGGMGAVWLGERDDGQFRQQVAVKLLRLDAALPEVQARFLTERRILAGLRHPNIATLLDGGTTPEGQPFVVMEYVDGADLLAHCEGHALPLAHRLELFRKVCAAVDHAHKNLVVHRDLKPANILVTRAGEPKLLDFGIAKLLASDGIPGETDADGSAATPALTMTGAMLLTPEYASPEQVRGETITTATDVYALGAVLYELLTGQRAHALQTRAPRELERVICERDPPPPSTAVAGAGAPLPAMGLPRPRLVRTLQGDLDTIVQRAMHKEPARRYGSAAGLAEDLDRLVRGLPVAARPDTFRYRTRKFLRRHRWSVAAAAAFVLLLVGATVTTAIQAARIARERDTARQQIAVAGGVADFLVSLFEMAQPDPMRAEQLSARAVLDRGTKQIRGAVGDDPLVRAGLLAAMGRAYTALGLFDDAAPLLEEARTGAAAAGAKPIVQANVLRDLGRLRAQRAELPAAERLLREAIAIYGAEHDLVQRADCRMLLADMFVEHERPDEATQLIDESERDYSAALGERSSRHARVMILRATILRDRGDFGGARQLLQRALALQQRIYGADHPVLSQTLRQLCWLATFEGRYDEARDAIERALAMNRRVLGDDHPDIDTDLFALAMLENDCGNLDRAEQLLTEILERDRRRFGDEHAYVALDRGQLAGVLSRRGDNARAEPMMRRALEVQRRTLPEDHPEIATTLCNLGVLYHRMGRLDDAEAPLRESLAIRERIYADAPDHPALLTSRSVLAVLQQAHGDDAGAAVQFRAVYEARKQKLGDHDQTAGAAYSLAFTLRQLGRTAEAVQLLDESVRIYREVLPPHHFDLARPLLLRARMLLDGGDAGASAAEPMLREALQCRECLDEDHPDRAQAEFELGRCLVALRRPRDAEPLLRSALQRCERGGRADGAIARRARELLDGLAK